VTFIFVVSNGLFGVKNDIAIISQFTILQLFHILIEFFKMFQFEINIFASLFNQAIVILFDCIVAFNSCQVIVLKTNGSGVISSVIHSFHII
jgi:hypothetical protein